LTRRRFVAAAAAGVAAALAGSRLAAAPSSTQLPVISRQHAPFVLKQFGVNLCGAEFGADAVRIVRNAQGAEVAREVGAEGSAYIYPDDVPTFRYFQERGIGWIRLPFMWERLQRRFFEPLVLSEVAGLRRVLDAAAGAGCQVCLEPHNFARYYHTPLRTADAPGFADFWQRIAAEFRGHPALWGYELVNEPHDLPEGTLAWAILAQAATNAIRTRDSDAWILVPGYAHSNAFFWPQYNAPLDTMDPAGRMLYAAHIYMDHDYSGGYRQTYDQQGASPMIGADRIAPFIAWLRERNARGMITEYGVPNDDPRWLTVLRNLLSAIEAEPRLLGGAYWAAGPWWAPTDRLSIQPFQPRPEPPQVGVLVNFPRRG
jgi:hypothetical protein